MKSEDVTLPTWMVVEDEPDIYDVLLAMFEIWGIEGVAFVDGAEAVSWIEEVDQNAISAELPELALLDIRVPEVTGPAIGERLRKSPRLRDAAIVFITAYRLTPQEEDSIMKQAEADALMYKPLPAMPELRAKLNGIISTRKAKSAASAPASVPVANPAQSPPTSPPSTPATPPKQD